MGYLEQHAELRKRFNDQWGNTTPIAWPNVQFEPPSSPAVPWVRFSIVDGSAGDIGIGVNAPQRYMGNVIIQVFHLPNKGDSPVLALADVVASVYRNWCGVNVRCRVPEVKLIGNDGEGWYQANVTIPFQRDEPAS